MWEWVGVPGDVDTPAAGGTMIGLPEITHAGRPSDYTACRTLRLCAHLYSRVFHIAIIIFIIIIFAFKLIAG